jgi:putative FmdB family regulatory protein
MIYEYICPKCKIKSDVIKPVSEYRRLEYCDVCKAELTRVLSSPQLMNTKVEDPYYSVALGTVVKDKKHEARIARSKGLIEVGNEDVKKHIQPPKPVEYPSAKEILYKEGLV